MEALTGKKKKKKKKDLECDEIVVLVGKLLQIFVDGKYKRIEGFRLYFVPITFS